MIASCILGSAHLLEPKKEQRESRKRPGAVYEKCVYTTMITLTIIIATTMTISAISMDLNSIYVKLEIESSASN
jgi:cell division protein FtsL